jgi:hypothetical protein
MTRTLFRTSGFRSLDRTFSIPSSDRLPRTLLAHAIGSRKPALRVQDAGHADEHRAPFEDPCFSDVWKDAQRSRTAFADVYVKAIVRRVRPAVIRQALAQADVERAPRADRKPGAPDVP